MRLFVLPATVALLSACAPTVVDDRAIVPLTDAAPPGVDVEGTEPKLADIELCDARDYRPLIGSASSTTTFPETDKLRVFGVNDIVTNDFIPQRTNVVYDENGAITRVYCG